MGGFCKNDKKTWGKHPQNERKCQILRKSAGRADPFLCAVIGRFVCPKIRRSEKSIWKSASAKENPRKKSGGFKYVNDSVPGDPPKNMGDGALGGGPPAVQAYGPRGEGLEVGESDGPSHAVS